MTIVYESDAEPIATRFDGMRDLFDAQLPIDIRLAGDLEQRRVRVVVGELGAITVMEAMSNVGGRCARTPQHIGRLDPNVYQMMVIKHGTMNIEYGVVERRSAVAISRSSTHRAAALPGTRPAGW